MQASQGKGILTVLVLISSLHVVTVDPVIQGCIVQTKLVSQLDLRKVWFIYYCAPSYLKLQYIK